MLSRLRQIWDKVRSSLWFIPGLCVGFSAVLALITPRLDDVIPHEMTTSLPLVYSGSESLAQSVLTTIATSMIGVAGVVFSMTIVSLQLASGQFGPRLLRTFLRNRTNQFVLGTFMGTFFYSIMVLPAIGVDKDAQSAAEISVTVAIALAVISLAMLVYYIDNIAQSIHADAVIRDVSRELEDAICHAFPENAMAVPENARMTPPDADGLPHTTRVSLGHAGYLRFVNIERLLGVATRENVRIELCKSSGEFIRPCEDAVIVYGAGPVEELVTERIKSALSVGPHRTTLQDPAFGFQQLTEMGVRALSPGINDPTTACHCVDRIGSAMAAIASRERAPAAYFGEHGRGVVVLRPQSLPAMMEDTIESVARAAGTHVAVYVCLLDALRYVLSQVRHGDDRDVILAHVASVMERAADSLAYPADIEVVRRSAAWAGFDQSQPAL